MNRRLATLAAAALSAAALAVPASAASRVTCLQIVDPSGDGTVLGVAPQGQDALDILSGDVATGKRNLVAAVRVKSLNAQTPVGGRQYAFGFTAGSAYLLTYTVDIDGATRAAVSQDNTATTISVDAAIDTASGTITWTVPRKSFAALKKPGAKITGLNAKASYAIAMSLPGSRTDFATPSDTASTGKSYSDMTPTCLKGT